MNVLDPVRYCLTSIISLIYFAIILTIEIVFKTVSIIIYVPILIVLILLSPIISTEKLLNKFKFLYRYGGEWVFCKENYILTSIVLRRLDR